MDSLFDAPQENRKRFAPLADRMRPMSLDEIFGQESAVGRGTFLYQMMERDTVPSLLLSGLRDAGNHHSLCGGADDKEPLYQIECNGRRYSGCKGRGGKGQRGNELLWSADHCIH